MLRFFYCKCLFVHLKYNKYIHWNGHLCLKDKCWWMLLKLFRFISCSVFSPLHYALVDFLKLHSKHGWKKRCLARQLLWHRVFQYNVQSSILHLNIVSQYNVQSSILHLNIVSASTMFSQAYYTWTLFQPVQCSVKHSSTPEHYFPVQFLVKHTTPEHYFPVQCSVKHTTPEHYFPVQCSVKHTTPEHCFPVQFWTICH